MLLNADRLSIGLGWAFVSAIMVQVFFAGLGVFTDVGFAPHLVFGVVVHAVSLLLLIVAAIGHLGRRRLVLSGITFGVVTLQISLAAIRSWIPAVAALHPVGALIVFALAIGIVRAPVEGARMRVVDGVS